MVLLNNNQGIIIADKNKKIKTLRTGVNLFQDPRLQRENVIVMKIYSVYILANKQRGTMYIGFINDLKRRMLEHRQGLVDGFSKKYDLKKLVYVDNFQYVVNAIAREKQFKRWHRQWKINLIEQRNSKWLDLYEDFFGKDVDPEINSG